MTIDDFLTRARRPDSDTDGPRPSFLIYTLGARELFHGEIVDTSSPETLLLRQADGLEVLLIRRHIVAITTATA